MSTVTMDPAATAPSAATPPPGQVTQSRVLRSEWIKMRTLRSTFYTLLAALVALIGLGTLFSAFTANHWAGMNPHERADFDPALTSLRGYFLAQLAFGVLG